MTVGQRASSLEEWEHIEADNNGNFEDLKTHIFKLSAQIQESHKFKQMLAAQELMELLAFQYILRAFFIDMEWSPKIGDTLTLNGFLRDHQLKRSHRILIKTLLERLEQIDILSKAKGTTYNPSWTISKVAPLASDITDEIKNIQTKLQEYPLCYTETEFMTQTGAELYNVLRGKVSGLDVLFPPETSYEFGFGAQALYANSGFMEASKSVYISSGILELARKSVAAGQNVIKILEIGAGTGSTTVPVLKALSTSELENLEIQFTFTDISNFFVGKSKQKIEKMFPTVKFEFESLDIENPKLEAEGGKLYDVVIAADVFHATQYLDDTLKHTREYLKPNGVLALGEVFKTSIYLDISFGLTEGWWRFADNIRGKNSPLIDNTQWEDLLKNHGFSNTFSISSGTFGVVFAAADGSIPTC